MAEIRKCPLCGKRHEVGTAMYGNIYKCGEKKYYIYDSIIQKEDGVEKERWFNCIYNFVENNPFYGNSSVEGCLHFYYDETEEKNEKDYLINVYYLMKQYPYQVIDRLDRVLLNLSNRFPLLSDSFYVDLIFDKCPRLFYCESKDKYEEIVSVFSALRKMEYIENVYPQDNGLYAYQRIAISGWQRIAELKKNSSVYKYGFIAMSFSDEVAYIETAFKKAIREAKYEPRIIKDKEHNNYVMPEIFAEIQKSKFVVVDVTKPNYGAYFEAGYAQALGKEVIVCCKKDVFDNPETKPHFDIAQKSTIVWTDENDLRERLKRRIEATVK